MPDNRTSDETLALGVVITGVLVLAGSAALQVVWLIAVAVAGGLGRLRHTATGGTPPGNGSAPAGTP